MASKRRQRRVQCQRKARHNRQQAITIAVRMRKQTGTTIEAYRCKLCGWWHVGRRPAHVHRTIAERRVG